MAVPDARVCGTAGTSHHHRPTATNPTYVPCRFGSAEAQRGAAKEHTRLSVSVCSSRTRRRRCGRLSALLNEKHLYPHLFDPCVRACRHPPASSFRPFRSVSDCLGLPTGSSGFYLLLPTLTPNWHSTFVRTSGHHCGTFEATLSAAPDTHTHTRRYARMYPSRPPPHSLPDRIPIFDPCVRACHHPPRPSDP